MKELGKEIFLVQCATGEWDNYHDWIDSLHETKEDADERVRRIEEDRNKFLAEPCPVGKDPIQMSFEESDVFWNTTYEKMSEEELKIFNDWQIKRDRYDEWHEPKIFSMRIGEVNERNY